MLMDGGKTKRQSKQTPRKIIELSSVKNVVCLLFRIIAVLFVGSLINQFMMFRSWFSAIGEKVFGKSSTDNQEQKSSDKDVGTCVDSGHAAASRSLSANRDNDSCSAENAQDSSPVCGGLTNPDENNHAASIKDTPNLLHNSNSSLEYATCTDSDQDELVPAKSSVDDKNDIASTSACLENDTSFKNSQKCLPNPLFNDNSRDTDVPEPVKKENQYHPQENENNSTSAEGDDKHTSDAEVVSVDYKQTNKATDSQNINVPDVVPRENASATLVGTVTTDDKHAPTGGVLDKATDKEENGSQSNNTEVPSTQPDIKSEPSCVSNVEQGIDVATELMDNDGNVMSNWVSLEISGADQRPRDKETENGDMEIVQVITSNQTITKTTEKMTDTKTSMSLESSQIPDEMMDVSMPTDCSNISVTDVKEYISQQNLSIECIETDIATVGGSPTAIINISYNGDISMTESVVQNLFNTQHPETNDHSYSKVELSAEDDDVHIIADTKSCEETDTYPCPDFVADAEEGAGFGDVKVINNKERRKFDLDIQNQEIKESIDDQINSCSTPLLFMEENGKNVPCTNQQDHNNCGKSSVEQTEDLISMTQGLDICEKDHGNIDTCSGRNGAVQGNNVEQNIDEETIQDYVLSCIDKAVVSAENSETDLLKKEKSTDETNENVDTEQTEGGSLSSQPLNVSNTNQNALGKLHEDPQKFLQYCQDRTSNNHIIDPKRLIYGLGHLKDSSSDDLKSAVLGQYKIAVGRKLNAWVKDLRYYAEILFSVDWVDDNLPSLQSTRKKNMKRSERRNKRQGKKDSSFTMQGDGMCRDIRLQTDPSIEIKRENALEDSSGDSQQLTVNSTDVVEVSGKESVVDGSGKETCPVEEEFVKETCPVVEGSGKETCPVQEEFVKETCPVVESGKETCPVVEGSEKETTRKLLSPTGKEVRREKVATVEDIDAEKLFTPEDSHTVTTKESLHSRLESSGTEQVDSSKNMEKTPVIVVSNASQSDENLKNRTTCKMDSNIEHMSVKGNKKRRKEKKNKDDKLKGKKSGTISKNVHQEQSSEVTSEKEIVSNNKNEVCDKGASCEYTDNDILDDLVNSFVKSIVESVTFDSKDPLSTEMDEDLNMMQENHAGSQDEQPGSIDCFDASGISASCNPSNDDPVVTKQSHGSLNITSATVIKPTESEFESSARSEDSFTDPAIIYKVKSLTGDSAAILKSPAAQLPEDKDIVCNMLMQSDQDISMDLASATSGLQQILKISPDPEHPVMNIEPSVECGQDPYISGIVNVKTDGEMVATLLGDTDFDGGGQVEYDDSVSELDGRGPIEYDRDSMRTACASHISELTDGQNVEESISQLVMERNHLGIDVDREFVPGEAEAYSDPVEPINVGDIEVTQQNQVSSTTESSLHEAGEVSVDIALVGAQAVENQTNATQELKGEGTRTYSDSNGIREQVDSHLSQNGHQSVEEKESSETNQIPVVISSRTEAMSTEHTDTEDRTERKGLIEIKMETGVPDSANSEHDSDSKLAKTFQAEFLQYCDVAPASSEEQSAIESVENDLAPSSEGQSAIASVENDYQQQFEHFIQTEDP